MKKKFFYIIMILLALVLQTTAVVPAVGQRNGLDIILMLVLAWSIIDGFNGFLSWAIFIGILYDMLSSSPVGLHVLIFLAVIYMVSFFSKRLSIDVQGTGLIIIILFVFGSVFFSQAVLGMVGQGGFISIRQFLGMFVSLKWFLLQLAYNLIAFSACFVSIKWMKRYFALDF